VAATALVSPHFDDAVLSCWHLVAAEGELRILNVFTGEPEDPGTHGWWDRMTGATDSRERVRERAAEDRDALSSCGRSAASLGFLDDQYRTEAQPLEPIVERLRSELDTASRLVAPAALGDHADHVLARDACAALIEEGHPLTLYADLPGATEYGWPHWVTGSEPEPYLQVDAHWDRALARFEALHPEVHELDGPELERKVDTIRRYRTQTAALRSYARLDQPEILRYEVTWDVVSLV
jgi:LmbE family N-acetylglucosaminyl deacetylase